MDHDTFMLWMKFGFTLLSALLLSGGFAMLSLWRRSTPERAKTVDEAVKQVERNRLAIQTHKEFCPIGLPSRVDIFENELEHFKEDLSDVKHGMDKLNTKLDRVAEGVAEKVATSVSGQFAAVLRAVKAGNGG